MDKTNEIENNGNIGNPVTNFLMQQQAEKEAETTEQGAPVAPQATDAERLEGDSQQPAEGV